MKKFFTVLILGILFVFSAAAQSSEKITEILKSEEMNFGQAAYIIATYKSSVAEDADYAEAFQKLQEEGLISEKYESDDMINLATASFLCFRSMNLNGGLFYKIFKNSRYAFKELQAKGALPKDSDPQYSVSGREFFGLFNACVEIEGE